ncbi:Rieske 2Fe-2S domain-containing protein [Streptomyces sp. URMC 127]|uniref:Rieske 2Fe-2S domain-containing protein n=1 Tax=Streptomyces sp. URMC 127 TaxID=3423402 RepID=UPI003F19962F
MTTPRLPYPDGWFAVAFREELPAGRVMTRRFMGEDIVLYRTRSGLVRAVRPFCPHLGAHLGYGGTVEGENIVCPFHRFAYSPDGTCVRTDYGAPPPRARLTLRHVREVDGAVVVWHHARGTPPAWEIPASMPAAFSPGGHVVQTVVAHPQDVMENAIDTGHGPPVHRMDTEIRRMRCTGTVMEVDLSTRPAQGRGNGYLVANQVHYDLRVHGLGWLAVRACVPGLRTRMRFWTLPVPVDPRRIELRLAVDVEEAGGIALPRWAARLLSKACAPLIGRDGSKDFPIWQHKTFVEHPKLAKGDGPIMEYRRWAGQFYSETTP